MAETNGPVIDAETSVDTTKRRLAPQFTFKADDNYENAKGKSTNNDSSTKKSGYILIYFIIKILIR